MGRAETEGQRRQEPSLPGLPPRERRHSRLEAKGLVVEFGGLAAVSDVDLTLDVGELLGLIGPNGAGKSTLVNTLTGFQKPTKGTIAVDGVDIGHKSSRARARYGVVRTFQGARLFGTMTVYDNIRTAAVATGQKSLEARRTTADLIDYFELGGRAEVPAADLTLGEERRLGIARALATRPSFLFLDEPAAGLNDAETEQLSEELENLTDRYELGLMVIEHDVGLIMRVCHRIQVLNYGRTIAVGTPDEIRSNPLVIEAYLGTGAGTGD